MREDAARDPAALLRAVRLARALGAPGRRWPGGEEADEERVLRLGAALLGEDPEHEEAEARVADVSAPPAGTADISEKDGHLCDPGLRFHGLFIAIIIVVFDILIRFILGIPTEIVARAGVRAMAQKQANHIVVALIRGTHERSTTKIITMIYVGAVFEKEECAVDGSSNSSHM